MHSFHFFVQFCLIVFVLSIPQAIFSGNVQERGGKFFGIEKIKSATCNACQARLGFDFAKKFVCSLACGSATSVTPDSTKTTAKPTTTKPTSTTTAMPVSATTQNLTKA